MTKNILLGILILLAGCADIQVESLPVADFNAKTAEVHRVGSEEWPSSCLLVAMKFVGDREGSCFRTIEIEARPEAFESAEVVIREDGILDDSLDGYRHRLSMHKTTDGYWLVDSADQSWKCQTGRGHTGYSCDPCH